METRPTSATEAKLLGLKRYFTGKPCVRDHIAERYACDSKCVECQRIKGRIKSGSLDKANWEKFRAGNEITTYTLPRQTITKESAIQSKLNRYYTAEACRNGHLAERYTSDDRCVLCDRKTRKIKRGTWTEADALTEKKNLVPVVALAKKNKTSTPKKVSEVPLTAYERLISKRARLHLSRLKPGYYDQDDISYSERILGYSRSDLSRTVGDKFSRENYHLDHIVPIKVLIQQGVTSPRIINHLDNLQFITARQNLKKGARLKKSDTWLLIKLTKLQDIENHSIKIQDDAYTKRPYWERACIELENSDGIKILYNGEPKKLQSTPSFPRTSSPKTYSDWKTTCVDAASNLIDYETEECLIFIRHFIRFDPSTEGWLDKKFGSFIGLDLRSLNAALVDVRCSFKQAASVLKYYDCNIKTLNELEPTKENIAKFESINSIENLSKYVGSFNNLLLLNLKSTRKGKGLIWRLFN